MQKLILIDGNAILHRAYHALPPLTNREGIVVNAVYGFFSMFLKILEDQKPDLIIVCFDKKAPTFRKELFVGYQAKRPKMSDDLVPQVVLVHEILQSAKVPIFEVDGYEADDLIGTIAFQSVQSSEELEVIILTGDRDMLQLVNSHVKVLAPIVGLTKMILFDEKSVEEKYGIKTSQFVDYKALVGDSSDNYPGVAGIGPKTASSLLQKYHSLENMYNNLADLPPKIMERLSVDAEQASLAKKLAAIVTDAPIKLELVEAMCSNFSMKSLQKEFEKLGFKSLLKRLGHKQEAISEKKKEAEQLGFI